MTYIGPLTHTDINPIAKVRIYFNEIQTAVVELLDDLNKKISNSQPPPDSASSSVSGVDQQKMPEEAGQQQQDPAFRGDVISVFP